MKHSKIWCISFLLLCLVILGIVGGTTAIVDPFFHFGPPKSFLQYPIDLPRYQNDGIVKNFTYDAIITGSSMSMGFKTTQCDELFDVTSIKVPFTGTSFAEISHNLQRAISANPDIKMVICSIDPWFLFADSDYMRTDAVFPDYLYDENLFNDLSYLFNKEVFFRVLDVFQYTKDGNTTTTFDAYLQLPQEANLYGKDNILKNYQRPVKASSELTFSQSISQRLTKNLQDNVISLAQANPDITFIYFFPPVSVVHWDEEMQNGNVTRLICALEQASEQLLKNENIRVFSFMDDYETVTNLDLYFDPIHYANSINSLMLQRMKEGSFELTADFCQQYWQEVGEFYTSYPYEDIFR